MIQLGTLIKCIDNTGVKKIMCIRILGKNSKTGKVGDIFIDKSVRFVMKWSTRTNMETFPLNRGSGCPSKAYFCANWSLFFCWLYVRSGCSFLLNADNPIESFL